MRESPSRKVVSHLLAEHEPYPASTCHPQSPAHPGGCGVSRERIAQPGTSREASGLQPIDGQPHPAMGAE